MQVTLELDAELAELVEFIPEEKLKKILATLLKEAIHSRSSIQKADNSSTEEIRSLVKLIEGISKGDAVRMPPRKNTEVIDEVVKKPTVISSADLADVDIDEDLLMMMK